MPSFEIPDGPTTIDVTRSAAATAVYSVTNSSPDSREGRLSVIPSGNSKAEWFSIEGNRERMFAAGGTETATVSATFPADARQGDYPFRLRVVGLNDPDNDHAEGPITVAKLGPIEKAGTRFQWWWVLVVLIAVAAVGGLVYYLTHRETPTVTPKPPPITRIEMAAAMFSAAAQPPAKKILFYSIKAESISDLIAANAAKSGETPPKTLKGSFWASLNLEIDDVCVTGKVPGGEYMFFFRRVPNDVQLAVVMGDFPHVPS
jgi:hypothetical protein